MHNIAGESVFFDSADGLRLHAVEYGHDNRDAVPVVCLPGLSRNARDFHLLAIHLSETATTKRRVVCFDYRGRGLSDHDPDWTHYNVVTEGQDVIAGMTALDIGPAAFVGTSRGGLITMLMSGMRMDLMRAAVLNDVGPVIEVDGIARIATMLSQPTQPGDWNDAAAIQKAAMIEAFPALSDKDWEFEAHARFRSIDGAIRPDHDPALAKTLEELDPTQPLPTLWPQFRALGALPVMLLRGENSAVLSRKTVTEMVDAIPPLHICEIEGQGHAPMLHTAAIPRAIERFLEKSGL